MAHFGSSRVGAKSIILKSQTPLYAMLTTTTLKAAGASQVIIHHFGAHITSWKNAAGNELLYTSPLATFEGPKAIRGGIPICFPQFGKKGNLKQHGFGRTSTWELLDASDSKAQFVLEDSEVTRSEWPHQFKATVTIELSSDGNSLTIDLDVQNKDTAPFNLTCAFHTYFAADALHTEITDLEGISNIPVAELMTDYTPTSQQGPITFHPNKMEHIFFDTPERISLPTLVVNKSHNLPDLVVWNPTAEQTMGDLPSDGYKNFVCLEAAKIKDDAIVEPGKTWNCSHTMTSK